MAHETRDAVTSFLDYPLTVAAVRVMFGGYFFALTLLLFSPNPYRLVSSAPGAVSILIALNPIAHFVSFALLTALTLLVFRSAPLAAISLGLSGYASLTELVQRLIPPRTAEWGDWFQDLGGIAVVVLAGWLVGAFVRMLRNVGDEKAAEASALTEGA